MGNIDVRNHLEMIYFILDRHDFPGDKFRIVPNLERAGMSWEGNILIREIIGESEAMPEFLPLGDDLRELLLRDHGIRVACLVLHEMYHCRNHFTPVSDLSWEIRTANEIAADEWALKQMGLIE